MTEPAAGTAEYTIDELSLRTRVPTRTIRFYQGKSALMAPVIRGRVAYYSEAHATRLALIAQLQDKGLRIDAIAGLCANIEKGELDLAEWLGVEAQMQTPWASDRPRTVTAAEVYALAGGQRPGLLADLVKIELLQPAGDVYVLASPALFAVAIQLEASGVDLGTSHEAAKLLRKHMAKASSELVEFFVERMTRGDIQVANAGEVLEALRPNGLEAVRLLFAREMEAALKQLLGSPKLAKVPGLAKRKPRK